MTETTKEATSEAPAGVPKKGGGAGKIIGMVLPGIIAAAMCFGAVKAAAKSIHIQVAAAETSEGHHKEEKPPGPTVALDPFLVSVPDEHKKMHPMKLTLAVEFDAATKEEATKSYTPRIRDAILSHMRAMTYEEAYDGSKSEKLRGELLEKCQKAGASGAQRILITDMVSQ